MRKIAIVVILACGIAQGAVAEDAAPIYSLDEVDALKIGKAMVERELIENQYHRRLLELETAKLRSELEQVKAQQPEHQFHRAHKAKSEEIEKAIDAAAGKAGIDRKAGWRPDTIKRQWIQDAPKK